MHVVICGGGFGGLVAAKKLAKKAEVTLIDKKPAFEYVPSLPFIVSKKKRRLDLIINYKEFAYKNAVNFLQDRILKVDHTNKTVICEKQQVKFDACIVALGSVTNTFGIPGIDTHGLFLKDIDDAEKVLANAENVLKNGGNITVCGGGLTGVELAAELHSLSARFQGKSKISLIEALPEIMPGFPPKAVAYARKELAENGIEVITNAAVSSYDGKSVSFKDGKKREVDLLVWTAGIKANPILKESSLKLSDRGALVVNPYLQVENAPDVYAMGDNIAFLNPRTQKPVLQTAQFAEQQAHAVVSNILSTEKKPYEPRAFNKTLVSVGNKGIYTNGVSVMTGSVPLLMKSALERTWLFRHR